MDDYSYTGVHTYSRTKTLTVTPAQVYTALLEPSFNSGLLDFKFIMAAMASIAYISLLVYLVWLPLKHVVAHNQNTLIDISSSLQESLISENMLPP